MKKIQIPQLTRVIPHWGNGEMIQHNDGAFVRWVEVRMLLSILVGLGIIEVKDSEFEVGTGNITEMENDSDDNSENLKSELQSLKKDVCSQFRKLRAIRVLVENEPKKVGIEGKTTIVLSAFADKILKILDSKPLIPPRGGSGLSDCQ